MATYTPHHSTAASRHVDVYDQPRLTAERPHNHQNMARRMGLWFTALCGISIVGQWWFAAESGLVIPPLAFLSVFGVIVGLTMLLVPGRKVTDAEYRLDRPQQRAVWGRLNRRERTVWIVSMLAAIPLSALATWELMELGWGQF